MNKIIGMRTLELASGNSITVNLYNSKLKKCVTCESELKPKNKE